MVERCKDRNITIAPSAGPVAVMFNGHRIAYSKRALDLKEGEYPVVIYIPRADVIDRFLAPSEHSTFCPYKGDASYFDLVDEEKISPEAVWYYADPCPLVEQIRDHVAFWGADITYLT